MIKRHTITEMATCWVIDGKIRVPKKAKKNKMMSWFHDFVFDLAHLYS